MENAGNYRLISLLPLASKILEKVVHTQLWHFLTSKDILPPEQFAYRPHHSAEDALVLATARWASALDRRDRVGLVFLDISKAFDCVQHRTLLTDLMDIGLTGVVLNHPGSPVISPTANNSFGPALKQELPTAAPAVCRKAVCLARNCFPSTAPGTYHPLLRSTVDRTIMFADDIGFECSGTSVDIIGKRLSAGTSLLVPWLQTRGLRVNLQKTQAMLLQPKGTPSCSLSVSFTAHTLQQVSEKRFLGLTVDDRLQWTSQVDRIVQKASRKLGALRKSQRCLALSSRLMYYKAVVQADLLYGAAAYHHSLRATDRKKITALTRAGVRTVMLVHPGLQHPRSSRNSKYSLSLSSCLLSSCYMPTVLSAVTLLALSSLLFFWFNPQILHSVSPGAVPTRHCAPPPPIHRDSLLPPRCHSLELSSYLCPLFS